jgi:uncharacterized phage-associated protein
MEFKVNNGDFLAIYANIGMNENLLTDDMPTSLNIIQSKIAKLMVICQGIFYAKHGKKLFDDSFLIDGKNKKEIDKIYFEFIKNYKGEIEERSFSHLDCDADLFLDKVVKYYHDVPINDLDIELRRVYGFEYLSQKEKQALNFEIDNNIFTYIDIIPVAFQLRYKRIEYRTAVNNIFWR